LCQNVRTRVTHRWRGRGRHVSLCAERSPRSRRE
jgi:hypothetical protein